MHQSLSEADLVAALKGVGLPTRLTDILTDSDIGAFKDGLFDGSHTLDELTDRPTTSSTDSIKGIV